MDNWNKRKPGMELFEIQQDRPTLCEVCGEPRTLLILDRYCYYCYNKVWKEHNGQLPV